MPDQAPAPTAEPAAPPAAPRRAKNIRIIEEMKNTCLRLFRAAAERAEKDLATPEPDPVPSITLGAAPQPPPRVPNRFEPLRHINRLAHTIQRLITLQENLCDGLPAHAPPPPPALDAAGRLIRDVLIDTAGATAAPEIDAILDQERDATDADRNFRMIDRVCRALNLHIHWDSQPQHALDALMIPPPGHVPPPRPAAQAS